MNKYYCKNWR